MIVTDGLLFLHLHKSGGTFVNALLMRCLPGARQLGYHLPYRETPPEFRHLPVLGTVRSPWAYYVSWYHFQISRPKPNMLFRLCSDDGRLGFADSVMRLVELGWDEERLAKLRDALPESYGQAGLNLVKANIDELRAKPTGFYSFLFERLYAGAPDLRIVRQEELRDGLRRELAGLRLLPNACAEQYLAEAPPRNPSEHAAPASYYDDRLATLVAERDRTVIARFGYRLEDTV